jgi:hypothetical protein
MQIPHGLPLPTLKEVRSYSGAGNNLSQPDLNQADTVFLRQSPAAYSDGVDAPSGPERPGPREVSNTVLDERGRHQDSRQLSGMVWAWGQFIDHDLTSTPSGGKPDWSIPVPAGDKHFDPEGKGQAIIPFSRSLAAVGTGSGTDRVREQKNDISGWMDASMVYGSSPERAAALRAFEGGRLKTSPGDLLPFNTMGLINDNPIRKPETSLMAAGDARANENLGLLSLQTLFLREHNRLVAEFAAKDPSLSDEALYQMARKVVGGLVQSITYQEYLPALLGDNKLEPYQGYRPEVDARISNEFSTAAFRMGHSQVEPIIWRDGADGQAIPERDVALLHAYFAPERLSEGGIDPLLRGLAGFIQEPTDEGISFALRNMLFGRPGKGGLDLAALNIQRGRDHGLPDLNTVRKSFGLAPFESFTALTGGDAELASKLASVYDHVGEVDPWVGILCEAPERGAAVGSTLSTIIADQFTRLRDGDRFWHGNDPDLAGWADTIASTSLTDVIRRNTEIGPELDESPFFGHKFRR